MGNVELISVFAHPDEASGADSLCSWFVAEDAFLTHYETVEEAAAYPDLMGKSVRVGPSQYGAIHSFVTHTSDVLGIETPACYVYESYSHTVDSEGLANPRLEISARAVRNLRAKELEHLVARELYHVAAGHLRTEVMAERMMQLVQAVPSLPGINILKQFGGGMVFDALGFKLRAAAFRWFHLACHSAERFASSYVGDIEASVRGILVSVLNERSLAESIDLKRFIQQAVDIELSVGAAAMLEKLNETLPYAPFRIRDILQFAISERGEVARAHLGRRSGV